MPNEENEKISKLEDTVLDGVAGGFGYAVDSERCIGCGYCKLVCPEGAVEDYNGGCRIIISKCTRCNECVYMCPVSCIGWI